MTAPTAVISQPVTTHIWRKALLPSPDIALP